MHKYEIVVYWSHDDALFIAEVPELAGCMAHGDSPAAALANAQQAIDLWLATAEEFGRAIPEPKGGRGQLV
jgi:predicted RNase H-like HicB family nuclease